MAKVSFRELYQPGFLAAVRFGTEGLFILTFLLWRGKLYTADASIDTLNAKYAIVGFIGLPSCAATLGAGSLAGASVITIFTVCVLFAGTIIVIETEPGPSEATAIRSGMYGSSRFAIRCCSDLR
jgi:malonate transporter and related proteins